MAEKIIGEVVLQGASKLIFSVNEWRGQFFGGIRKFVTTQRYEGPTKSGLALNKKLLQEVVRSLAALEKTVPAKVDNEIAVIPKNGTENIKISTLPSEDGEALPAVDVREFVDSPTYQGPTKKGLRFRWDLLPGVLSCMREQIKAIGEVERNEPTLFGTGAFAEPEEVDIGGEAEASNADGLVELLGEPVKAFPDAFLDGNSSGGKKIKLPEDRLQIGQDNGGKYHLRTGEGVFCEVRNPPEAHFIIYSQMRGHVNVAVPKVMLDVFKSVKAYENYARAVKSKLMAKLIKKAGQRSVAEYEARKKMEQAGLPWLNS
jgi:hypothetical protein